MSVTDINYFMYYAPPGIRYTSVPGGGFDNAAISFAKPFESKIKLDAKVIDINYYEEDQNVIIYYLENGVSKMVISRTALVTTSLGVLKAGTVNFIPSLTETKLDPIKNIGFGLLNKCIMYWDDTNDDIVGPREKEWFGLVTPEEDTSGKWTFFQPHEFKW